MDKKKTKSKQFGLIRFSFSLLFVAILLLPAAFRLVSSNAADPETRGKMSLPGFQTEALLEPGYYKTWTHFLKASLSSEDPLTQAKRWMDYHLFGMTDAPEVHVGNDGWLFDQQSISDFRKNACHQASRIRRLVLDLHAAARIAEASGRRLIFSVAPSKATVYPEYVGAVPQNRDCGQNHYDLMLKELAREPLKNFVRLDETLSAAKSGQELLYDKTGAYWNRHGAAVVSKALVANIFDHEPWPTPTDDDLTSALMGRVTPKTDTVAPATPADDDKHLSAAVVYGGPAVTHLLPGLARRFDRVDVISSDIIPSLNHNEDLSAYEAIVVIANESHLANFRLDMDRLFAMLGSDALASAQVKIDLGGISAEAELSLSRHEKGLTLKSLGADAYIRLPMLPGSTNKTLRILKMDLTMPHTDVLTWTSANGLHYAGTRSLRPGPSSLYLTLPRQTSIKLRINPGQTSGMFHVQNMTLLEFSESAAPGATDSLEVISYPVPLQKETRTALPPTAAPLDLAVTPVIKVNDFEAGRIFQRKGSSADIMVSGTYQGSPEGIEAQVVDHGTGEVILPWTLVDSAPTNGVFMGIISEVPQGGWYRILVRFSNQLKVSSTGQASWGVGILVGCIGQSNMREWFYTGSDLKAHNRLALHRNGRWMPMGQKGHGAIAFGNRLIGKVGIPVGLLDYAVNGSGLRREADWGKGYWADRSPGSIYDHFIQGVAAAGGTMEYVIWMQGEADAARNTISKNQYRNTLKAFISHQIRADIANASAKSELPFLIVGMTKRPKGKDNPHQAIRNAQAMVAQEVKECYLAATTLDLKNLGRQHLDPEAYITLGLRVAQTVLYILGKESYYRGPSMAEIKRIDDSLIDIRLTHRGGTTFVPTNDISGWQVHSKGRAIPITQAMRYDRQTVRLQLAQPVTAPLSLRYLYGAMPDASRAAHDNTAMELPLEPFEQMIE